MAPQVGLEPTTLRLTAGCSAIELLRNIGKAFAFPIGIRQRSTLPGRLQPSTIDAEGLNFCVRDGNRWNPFAIVTGNGIITKASGLKALAQGHLYASSALLLPFRAPRLPFASASFCRRSFLPRAACSFVSYSYRSACRTLTTAHLEVLSFSFFLPWSLKTSARPISNDNLHTLPRFQRRPIYLLVFQGSHGNLILVVGFTLRCFQRLSRPYFASQLCPWQDNCCTSGTSTPVLSY